jgi:hypothetical protein
VHCCSEDCIKLVRVAKIFRVANHKFIFELPSASQWILRRWNRRSAIDLLFQTRLGIIAGLALNEAGETDILTRAAAPSECFNRRPLKIRFVEPNCEGLE